ncbi:hypothetical protein MJD09_08100 [bacterium]|nr:hypothetical protein [bacterium]
MVQAKQGLIVRDHNTGQAPMRDTGSDGRVTEASTEKLLFPCAMVKT